MKKLKLFFALFAMLALGVSNAWGAETETITLSSFGWANATVQSSIAATSATISLQKNSASTSPTYYTSDGLRLYGVKSATTGGTISFTPKTGITISKIVFTHTASNSGVLAIKTGEGSYSSKTWSGTLTEGNTVSLVSTNSGSKNPQVKITKIVITYETASSGGETPDPITISLDKTTLNLQEGATETLTATVTGSTSPVTWSSSKTAVASVDNTGKVTAVAAGEATITAAIGDVKATCSVIVTAASTPEEPGTGGESGSYTWDLSKKTYTTGTNEVTWTCSIATMHNTGTNATNYLGGDANSRTSSRFYTGNTLTITPAANISISSVEFTATSENYASVLKNSTWTNASASVSSSTVTITPSKGASAISATIGGTCGFKGVTVYYTQTGSGSGETAPSLTTDQFSWSATTATATLPNTFDNPPTLTNTENLVVSYSSSNEGVAKIDANGNVTLVGVGTADIKATAGGEGTTFKETTVYYTLTVEKAPATPTDNVYVKVTTTAGITDGEYLIVYETGKVAFDGSLATLDAISNTIDVEITDGKIAGTNYIDLSTFTIDATEGTIKSASGYYIGQTSDANGLKANTSTKYTNDLTIGNDGTATVKSGGAYLRYNSDANNWRFRYYKSSSYSGQKAIALYKKASKHTVTIADCTNGSVSAKMGETTLATNDQVLSGIQITLSNEAATGYKLAAYDVYKKGDNTTKVTVTDGKFIMPEFDVTISATFELAKTLTGIEITNAATQNTFWQGETFNHNGLKVTAHFEGAEDEDVTSKITVTGSTATAGNQTVTVSYKEGEVTKDATYTITVKAIPNTKETAYTVADAFDIIDKLGDTDKMYITGFVSQADLEQSSIDQYKNADYWISADGTTNGQQLEAFRGKYLDNTDFTSVNQIMVGDEVIIYGKLTKYGSTYEFAAGNYLVSLKRDKQQPELSYTTTEYNVNLGEAFTAPTLNNPYTLAVTYSSSNEDVATVAADGAVTIKAAGTVKITASFAGNDDYVAGSASYTINITDPNQLEVTFDATQDLDDNNATKGAGKLTKTPITFACTDGILGSSTYGHYRIYVNAKATFSAAEGYIITKVVLTSTASGTLDNGPAHLDSEDGTYTYEEKVGTWVGEAYIVTLSASKQVRANTITVYYKQDNRTDAGLAWNPATISLTVGDAFTAPTFSNPNRLTVSFESSNSELATVNNAGVISLVSGKTGTATITATFVGTETYKPAEVTCIISVNPKTEDVVIVAQQGGKWYALKAEDLDGANKTMAALEVEYINGVVYNLSDAEKTAITWERAVIGNQVTFKHGDKYLFGTSGSTDLKLNTTSCDWTYDGAFYKVGNRTFLYRAQATGFKNYATTNIGNDDYAARLVVTAAKFENATIITRSDLSAGNFGTICYENNITNFTGATFYEVAGKEGRKVIFDEVTELVAGMPYIFRAEATELKIVLGQENATTAGQHNSLQGTFDKIVDGEAGEAGNTLEGNYIIYNNFIKKCGAKCGLLENRAYFIADALNNLTAPVSPAPGRKRVSMDVLGENEATGVDNITENGVIAPAMQGTYDVLGRQLSEPTATGFYIVNGKKVFVVK